MRNKRNGGLAFPLLYFLSRPHAAPSPLFALRPLAAPTPSPLDRPFSRPSVLFTHRKMLSFFATTLLLGASTSLGALASSPGHALNARAPHANAGPAPALFARQATATIPSAVSATATATATTTRLLPTGTASRVSSMATGSIPMSPLASLFVFRLFAILRRLIPLR